METLNRRITKSKTSLPGEETISEESWAGTFEGILQTRTKPRTDCTEQLPNPVKIRLGDANEDAKVSEFQQELIQLAAVLKGDSILTSYLGKIGKDIRVREGKEYMEDVVKRFFESDSAAKLMGVVKNRS
ncbi:Non-specific phospholipase C2 [Forsythia ovata]|uniref:Non-specific phospholipase C2 n=1 Tax=Forsythia ovata TaxID=205694 RepID=A0ABD1VF00_9LAMI